MSKREIKEWFRGVREGIGDRERALWARWDGWWSAGTRGRGPGWVLPLVLVGFGAVAFWGLDALARPGGGHTYSGGGGGGGGYHGGGGRSSGGGGGGGGELVFWLFLLAFEHPVIGIPLLLLVVGGLIWAKMAAPDSSDEWDSSGAEFVPPPPPKVDMSPLREHDPNFSQLVFEDFLNNLYVRAQQSRSSQERMSLLSPYLSEQARTALLMRRQMVDIEDVTAVVVGAQKVIGWTGVEQETVRVSVQFEANYTERYAPREGQPGGSGDYYAREIWVLERKRDLESRRPDQVSDFECPNCGAPVEGSQDEVCAYCGAHFGSGEFDWFVASVALQEERTTPPRLTGTVEEQGTLLSTVRDPNLEQGIAVLKERDPAFGMESIQPRIELIFSEMQQAWSSLDWEKARPFLTDRLFLSMSYWVEAYRKSGLRNITTDNRITNVEIVKVETDPFFDIVTVRLYANGHDFTVDANGNVVSGSKDRERAYSEYWTLVRSVQSKGTDKDPKTCPNCGAPLSVNQTGHCEYCGSKVTGGDFDWVLSRIEQDDSYS